MKDKETERHFKTNAPKNIELTIRQSRQNRYYNDFYPGNSVNEHKNIEIANEIIGSDEIKQQQENS